MRDKDFYLIIDAVPADPKAPSGHKHNSRLSFELCAFGESFIIGPGTYIYTADAEMRNLFRSTAYHNTVVVDGEEQSSFRPDELFWAGNEAKVKVNAWEVDDGYDFWDGEHHGYTRLTYPVIHHRQVYFDKKEHYWLIKDILSGKGIHQFGLFFHFSQLETGFLVDDCLSIVAKGKKANIAIVPLTREGLKAKFFLGWVSCRYGVKEEAPILCYYKETEVPVSFCTLLYPYREKINLQMVQKEISQKLPEFIRESG